MLTPATEPPMLSSPCMSPGHILAGIARWTPELSSVLAGVCVCEPANVNGDKAEDLLASALEHSIAATAGKDYTN